LPFLSFPFCCTNTIGPNVHYLPKGEVPRMKNNPQNFWIGAANAPNFSFHRGKGASLHLQA
jgi:hypothetical protein